MINAKKMNEQLVHNILKSFKDGTYDALMYGIRSETNKNHFYKQGYDFGLVLYNDQIDEENNNAQTS